jgi:hypothetical protein
MNAARAIMKDYRGDKPKTDTPPEGENVTIAAPPNLSVDNAGAAILDMEALTGPEAAAAEIAPDLPPPSEGEKKSVETKPRPPSASVERVPVEHRQVDVHDIFDEIYTYLTALETRIKELGPDAEQAKIDEIKKEAALDIISLIHKRIDNA